MRHHLYNPGFKFVVEPESILISILTVSSSVLPWSNHVHAEVQGLYSKN